MRRRVDRAPTAPQKAQALRGIELHGFHARSSIAFMTNAVSIICDLGARSNPSRLPKRAFGPSEKGSHVPEGVGRNVRSQGSLGLRVKNFQPSGVQNLTFRSFSLGSATGLKGNAE